MRSRGRERALTLPRSVTREFDSEEVKLGEP